MGDAVGEPRRAFIERERPESGEYRYLTCLNPRPTAGWPGHHDVHRHS